MQEKLRRMADRPTYFLICNCNCNSSPIILGYPKQVGCENVNVASDRDLEKLAEKFTGFATRCFAVSVFLFYRDKFAEFFDQLRDLLLSVTNLCFIRLHFVFLLAEKLRVSAVAPDFCASEAVKSLPRWIAPKNEHRSAEIVHRNGTTKSSSKLNWAELGGSHIRRGCTIKSSPEGT